MQPESGGPGIRPLPGIWGSITPTGEGWTVREAQAAESEGGWGSPRG